MQRNTRPATADRAVEVVAMLMIGDAVVALLYPVEHLRLWQAGPAVWRKMMDAGARRPGATRGLALAELGLGLWLAARQVRRARAQAGIIAQESTTRA